MTTIDIILCVFVVTVNVAVHRLIKYSHPIVGPRISLNVYQIKQVFHCMFETYNVHISCKNTFEVTECGQ